MILIKNVEVYEPKYLGKKDILIVNDKIGAIEDSISEDLFSDLTIIDGSGKKAFPGLIDNHVHITGGGGEGSFKTKVPELQLSKLIKGGITTVVGLLGTDGITRSVENLLSKAKAFKEEGISCYINTGSYGYPSTTITGEVAKDIVFIDEVIGVKIAISDHRSPSVTKEEFARLASDARVAGMLSGKAGIVVAHMGDHSIGLGMVEEVLEETAIPRTTIRPTHVNRKPELFKEALDFAKKGGYIDLTCGMSKEHSPRKCVKLAKEAGVPLENITISSDGYGSWSNYDEKGNLIEIGAASVESLFKEFRRMVLEEDLEIEEALIYFTSNVAKALSIYPDKGRLAIGSHGDMILVDSDFNLDYVIARGQIMMENKEVLVKGTYE